MPARFNSAVKSSLLISRKSPVNLRQLRAFRQPKHLAAQPDKTEVQNGETALQNFS